MRTGFLLFDRITQLDLTGPFEVLASVPDAQMHVIAKTLDPVKSDRGLRIVPSTTYADCPELDMLVVPGGPGINTLLNDDQTLDFIARMATRTKYVASVCTGSLVLAAAGLLQGRRAATHWAAREFLAELGAIPVAERTVIDLPFITGGGVTAGIDFAFTVIGEVYGSDLAEQIQLRLEYAPDPPFQSGSPDTAQPEVVAEFKTLATHSRGERALAVTRARERLIADGRISR